MYVFIFHDISFFSSQQESFQHLLEEIFPIPYRLRTILEMQTFLKERKSTCKEIKGDRS